MTNEEQEAIYLLYYHVKDKLKISKLYLFGSKARGDDNKYSDVDLLVLTSNPKTLEDRWELTGIAADINIDYGISLNCLYFNENDWKNNINVNPILKENVEKDGIEVVL